MGEVINLDKKRQEKENKPDLEKLKLQAELYQERIIRFELQSQLMGQQYEQVKKLLAEVLNEIKELEKKGKTDG
jgi:predicted HTH domain antitoxin